MTARQVIAILFLLLLTLAVCRSEQGTASWYGHEARNRTANGEVYHPEGYTCASWRYPFGTWLLVRNVANGKSVVVRVNDRGPAKRLKRVLDLSEAAFKQMADPSTGLVQVTVTRLP